MKIFVFLSILILSFSQTVCAQEWSAKIIDYGVYEITSGSKVEDENVAGGLTVSYGKKLIKKTTHIDARIGVNFGFRYTIDGPEDDAEVTIKIIHPKALIDPETNKKFNVSEWSQSVPKDHVNWNAGWIFEQSWEIVEGTWTMQIFIEDKMLLEKSFMVTDARNEI